MIRASVIQHSILVVDPLSSVLYCSYFILQRVISASVIQHSILVVDPLSSVLYCSYFILQRVISASVIQHSILVVDPFSSFLYCSYSILQRDDYSLCYSTSNSSGRSLLSLPLLSYSILQKGVITDSVIQHPILVVDPFSSFLYCSYFILQSGDYSLCYSTSISSCRSLLFLPSLSLFYTPEGLLQPPLFNIQF